METTHLNGTGTLNGNGNGHILFERTTILDEAAHLVSVDRAEDYGPCDAMCERIGKIWTVILGQEITSRQVALCLLGMKLAREAFNPKRDNRVDLAGYAHILDIVTEGTLRKA